MKKILKKCSTVSLCIIGIGIVLLVIGLLFGGRLGFTLDIRGHKVITKDTKEETYVEKTLDLDAFSKLELNVGTEVELKRGDTYQIQYYLLESEVPTIEVKDESLTVKSKDGEFDLANHIVSFQFFDFEWTNSNTEKEGIVITIPKDVELSEANIKVEAGNVRLTDFIINKAYVSSAYGDVEISNFTSDEMNVLTESGDTTLTNVAMKQGMVTNEYGELTVKGCSGENSTLILESGNCWMEDLKMDQLQVTNQYGDVELKKSTLNSYEADCESGEIKMEDCTVKKTNLNAEYGDIDIEKSIVDQIQAVCESGDTEIDLQGLLSEYDMDLVTESGRITINDQENGEQYKNITNKGKSITVKNEYGDIEILVK